MKNCRRMASFMVCCVLLMAFMILLSGSDAARAQQSSYPSKRITWVVPYGPGGGFDVIGRAVAPVMREYLPNKVDIIIRNIPGGGGRKGVTWVYKAKPDGYTFGYVNIPGQLVHSLVHKTAYDLEKVEWIGNVASEPTVLYAATRSGVNSFEDLMKAKGLKFGSGGKGSGEDINGRLANAVLGLNAGMVTGYSGSHEVVLGLIRGDADLIAVSASSGYEYVKNGDLKPILILGGTQRSSLYPDTPTSIEKGYGDLSAGTLYRAIFAPPGTPREIVGILSEALTKAINDKKLTEWSEKTGRAVGPAMTREELKKDLGQVIAAFKKYAEVFK